AAQRGRFVRRRLKRGAGRQAGGEHVGDPGNDRYLELSFDSSIGVVNAEHWFATLRQQEWDENDNLVEGGGTVLATARIVRVNLLDGDWMDSLDAETGDLQSVGAAFD